ncbi:hypothetical protein GJAV_G00033090 [Gymnothorax javanicus]|nr:hypothetical protein GJAV_G00033090 [Gymnothorax javanicus]
MNFLANLRNLQSGAPAPPKRLGNYDYSLAEDEIDEDGGTYEAPPSERAVVKVPVRQEEENVYLGERSLPFERPSVPHPRQQALPLRPPMIPPISKVSMLGQIHDSKSTYVDPSAQKRSAPLVNRDAKPGRKPTPLKTPPPRPGPAPLPNHNPTPVPRNEDDVYLDPNESQGEHSDELYLDPNAATCPFPRVCMRTPLPPRPNFHDTPPPWAGGHEVLPTRVGPFEAPPPMVKPPIPRALSRTHFQGGDVTATLPEANRPIKQNQSDPGIRFQLPPPLKESKSSPPHLSPSEHAPGGLRKSSLSEVSPLQDKEWFAGYCDRKTAEATLFRANKDGAFLVRYSSAQNTQQPYTLVVLYREKVYNIPIRYLEDTQGYALGKEGKKSEELFSGLQEMISHHKNTPILLIDCKNQAKQTAYLTHPTHP